MCFDELKTLRTMDGAQSPNKEPMAGITESCHVAVITHQDSILDSYNNSTNKTPTNDAAATETYPTIQPDSSAQFRIPVETTKEGVVVLHGGLIPYVKSSLNVAHAIQYWSYYAHILLGNNLSFFPALTEDNIQDFIDRLNIIQQEVLSIGKTTFESEIVSAFNHSGHTSRVQTITCTNTLMN